MVANVGAADRVLRVLLGVALVAFGLLHVGGLRWLGLAGPVLIATALLRFCPAYWLLRIRTLARPPARARASAP